MQMETLNLIVAGKHKKGDVLGIARIAGIMAAKRTPDLIPLCHTLLLSKVALDFAIDEADPLAQLAGNIDHVGTLALHGIIEPAQLTALDKPTIKTLASQLGVSEKQIQSWMKAPTQEE